MINEQGWPEPETKSDDYTKGYDTGHQDGYAEGLEENQEVSEPQLSSHCLNVVKEALERGISMQDLYNELEMENCRHL